MKVLWCWRCKTEVPMLDDDEFKHAMSLHDSGISKDVREQFGCCVNTNKSPASTSRTSMRCDITSYRCTAHPAPTAGSRCEAYVRGFVLLVDFGSLRNRAKMIDRKQATKLVAAWLVGHPADGGKEGSLEFSLLEIETMEADLPNLRASGHRQCRCGANHS